MKNYIKILFCLLFGFNILPSAFSQNDTTQKRNQTGFLCAEMGIFPLEKQFDINLGYGIKRKMHLLVLSAGISVESRHLINNGYRWYNSNFYYSYEEKNIVKSRQTGISVPLIVGLETRGNIRWNIGFGATPYLGVITVTSLNFKKEESENGFKSGKYMQLIGDNTPIENSERNEYINPAKSGYDISYDFQTGFSFGNSKKQKAECYIKLRMGLIEQIETRTIGQFGIVEENSIRLYDSLLFGIRYYL